MYAIDTGLIKAVTPQFSVNNGSFLENIVFLELKRRQKEIYYYSDNSGREIDFVIKEGTQISELIQVSWDLDSMETKNREVRSLINNASYFSCHKLTIITLDKEAKETISGHQIQIIPIYKWLLG